MKTGDIVRWTCKGCEPEQGVVVKATDKRVWLKALGYAFERNLSDGDFEVLRDDIKFVASVLKPMVKEIDMAKAKTAKKVPAKKTVAKTKKVVGKTGDGPSKMDLAMDILRKSPNLTRAQAIAKFIDDAKLTKAGAATYWSLVNRKLKKEKSAK